MPISKNSVIYGDCFEHLSEIEDNFIDLIVIDPPYLIGYNKEIWDTIEIDYAKLFQEFNRIIKPDGNIIIFQGWTNVCRTIEKGTSSGLILKNWIVWDRIKGRGAKTNLVSTREDILWFIKSASYTYNKIPSTIVKKTKGMGQKNGVSCRAMSNVWTDIPPIVPWSKERVGHPTQKPLKIMERIISIWSNEGDVVLDCFAGSGSSLVAAKNLNRYFIGIEKDEKYYNIIINRMELNKKL